MAISDRSIRNPLVVKLSQFAALSDEDVGLLEALCLPEERMLNSTPPEILRYFEAWNATAREVPTSKMYSVFPFRWR